MIIPAGYAQATLTFGGPALPLGAAITFGVQVTGSATPLERAAIVYNEFQANMLPNLGVDVTMLSCRWKEGPNSTGAFVEYFESASGGAAGGTSTPQVAFLVQKRTAFGGRKNRGRMYLPGVRESDVGSDGAISGTIVTNINLDAEEWRTDMSTLGLPMVLLHNASSDPTPITSLAVSGKVATQRRRVRR